MSLEEVLTNMSNKLDAMSQKFEDLQADVDSLKATRERTNEASRSRSRSPRRPDRSRSRSSSSRRTPPPRRSSGGGTSSMSSHRSWADIHPEEVPVYDAEIRFPDEGEGDDVGPLTEVSEETERLLKTSCTRSVSNEVRRRTRSRYKLPKVEATRTPRLDHFMHTLAPQTAKVVDRELSRIQTFVLDSLAPLTAILDNKDNMSIEDVKEASITAVELIGNANAKISRLRREKLVSSINKSLVPLVKEDSDFSEVAPNLFGPEFSKRAKDFVDQVKTLRSSFTAKQDLQFRKPLFRRGHPSERGMARTRGGGPNQYRGGQRDQLTHQRQ